MLMSLEFCLHIFFTENEGTTPAFVASNLSAFLKDELFAPLDLVGCSGFSEQSMASGDLKISVVAVVVGDLDSLGD